MKMVNKTLSFDESIPLQINDARSLAHAVNTAYTKTGYSFNWSPWFIDIKDRFRIFTYQDVTYIAKWCQKDEALKEIEKSLQVASKFENVMTENRLLHVIVPELITTNSGELYLVSKYMGMDLNGMSYKGIKPLGCIEQYIHLLKFMIDNGVTHPGFLPRNLVERGKDIYLFDWEDAILVEKGNSAEFDRLWYTNFVLNWSHLFPRHQVEQGIKHILDISPQFIEPPLTGYEKTFKELVGLISDNSKDVRDAIESVVFGAELPIASHPDPEHLRPNDRGHLYADIFFKEIDVMNDIAGNGLRISNESLYGAVNCVVSQIISLCRGNGLKNIHYYATLGLVLLISATDYTQEEYQHIAKEASLSAIRDLLLQYRRDSFVTAFIEGRLEVSRLHRQLIECIEKSTKYMPPTSSPELNRIINYILDTQKDVTHEE